MPDTIQVIRKVLHDSIDSIPDRVSVFFTTGSGDYAEHDRFMGITVSKVRKIAEGFSSITLEDLGLVMGTSINCSFTSIQRCDVGYAAHLLRVNCAARQHRASSGSKISNF